MSRKRWKPSTSLVHALFSLGCLSGVAVSYDYLRDLGADVEPNPLARYLHIDIDAALEEFFAA